MTSTTDLADWNIKRAEALEAQARTVFFKDTAAEHRRQASMHRATAKALLSK